jgi:hypothetical protein
MILAGQSAGGMVSLFTAGTRAPQGLVAVLSFAGGRGGDPERAPACRARSSRSPRCSTARQADARAGALQLRRERSLLQPAHHAPLFDRFTAGGADAEYILQPAFGKDGHYLFSDVVGVRYWLPTVERFLARHNVPFERLDAADPVRQPLLAVDRLPEREKRRLQGAVPRLPRIARARAPTR